MESGTWRQHRYGKHSPPHRDVLSMGMGPRRPARQGGAVFGRCLPTILTRTLHGTTFISVFISRKRLSQSSHRACRIVSLPDWRSFSICSSVSPLARLRQHKRLAGLVDLHPVLCRNSNVQQEPPSANGPGISGGVVPRRVKIIRRSASSVPNCH